MLYVQHVIYSEVPRLARCPSTNLVCFQMTGRRRATFVFAWTRSTELLSDAPEDFVRESRILHGASQYHAAEQGRGPLAGATGPEPAASCVTGRRSNQLNYAPALKLSSLPLRGFLPLPLDSQKLPENAESP